MTGNKVDGEDLGQDIFIKVFKNLSRFREDSKLKTWIYRICINEWKNRVKYEKRRAFWKHISFWKAEEGGEESFHELESNEREIDRGLELEEQQKVVFEALSKLETQEREVVVLRDMEDQSYEDISLLLNVPVGTVKSRLSRSRDHLKEILQPYLNKE